MSESPTYKKIRDLTPKEEVESSDELAVSDKDTLTTNRVSINNLVKAAFSHSNSIFEADASGNLTLKLGAIDGSKIAPGTIKTEQLAPNSITAEHLNSTAVQESITSNKTSKTVLTDEIGIERTISSAYYGVINLMVNTRLDGIAYPNDHEDGPNPRDFDFNGIDGDVITVEEHGLENGGAMNITSAPGSSFPESSPIMEGERLYAIVINSSTFSVSKTSGGSALNLGPGWNGEYTLNRDTIVAKDISAYISNSYTPKYAATVNYNFSTVESAYSWCARNANLTFLNILIGHSSNPLTFWNSPGESSRLTLDREFVKPKVLSIYGNRDNGLDRSSGWVGEGGATSKGNYHPYNRARLHIYTGGEDLALWFRGQSELKLAGLWMTFDFEGDSQRQHLINLGKAIVHWTNVSCEVINRSSGGSGVVMKSGEHCNLYLMGGGKNYFGGLTSHGFMYIEGYSSGGAGMPSSWTYVVTEASGVFKKRKYLSHSAGSLFMGRTLDNNTGAFTSHSTTMEFSDGSPAF